MGMGVLYRAAMQTIAEAIAAELADWDRPPGVERTVLGTDDPTEIERLIEASPGTRFVPTLSHASSTRAGSAACSASSWPMTAKRL